MTKPICPHCRKTMEEGHLVDHSHTRLERVLWVAGPADWTGVKWRPGKLENHDVHSVVTYRCPSCGRLESFARARTSKA